MKALAVGLALVVLAAAAPAGAQQQSAVVRVAAASDLRFALDEIATAYRRAHPDTRLELSYGSSGTFHAQILQGAPYDLFLSADVRYPNDLAARGQADASTLFTYAIGRIVLWVPAASSLDVNRGLDVLKDPHVRHIAIANPEHAPYGKAAEDAMRAARVLDAVRGKLVRGENITQTAQFVESGAADIGIIARSLALAPSMRTKGRYWEVPPAMYPVMEQGGVVLARAGDRAAAMAFRAFLLAPQAQKVLATFGFVVPGAAK